MVSEITAGVEITVQSSYEGVEKTIQGDMHLFAYKIKITNLNVFTVQLLRRKWMIKNGFGETEVVKGEGVVGRQPVLYQNDEYEYVSGCRISSEIGKMEGIYYFENKINGEEFEVRIPSFLLEVPENKN